MTKPSATTVLSGSMGAGSWSLLWFFFGSMLAPVIIPWILYRIFRRRKSLKSLRGKVVLITGASSGLGEALAHVFYRVGCRIILASRRVGELQRVKEELSQLDWEKNEVFEPVVLKLDLSELASIPDFAKAALRVYGHVDILINNGGISYRGTIESTNVDVDMRLMTVNYFGQVCLTKAILPSMIKRKSGHIVAVSSVQGKISIPFRSAYAASKHAVQAFFDCLSAEGSRHNINVTVVCPGYINTNLSINALTGSGSQYGVLDDTTASGPPPREVANGILNAILTKEKEVVLAPLQPRIAIVLRAICPSLYFFIMQRRAMKHN